MPFARASMLASLSLSSALACAAACSSTFVNGTGGAGVGGASGSSTSASVGGAAPGQCPQVATMLDVSNAPGAGDGYPKPTLTASCTDTEFVVDGNGIPTYTFVETTPNPLKAQPHHWSIPRAPAVAASTTAIPLLGVVGFAVNGIPFYGPNEAAQPANEAYGDPVYNGLMDACFGHTSPGEYHYHSMLVKCLVASGLVAEPWTNADPPASEASPIIAWALDGFPIYGAAECADAGCGQVVVMQSGYDKIGDPTTNAWKAYAWKDHAPDATFLDACNGHTGPKGDYHYHVTAGFPYILGCYKGTPAGGAAGGMPDGGAMGGGGMMGGPKACGGEADCAGACPGAQGCTCHASPMGKVCVPTCATAADCPPAPMGAQFMCHQGVCVP